MTIELSGDQGRYEFTNFGWKMAIDLGRAYGWRPAGALPLEHEPDEELDDNEWDNEWDARWGDRWGDSVVVPKEFDDAEARGPALLPQFLRDLWWTDRLAWSYLGDGQEVTADDARALGAALGRALPDVPSRDARDDWALEPTSSPEVLVFANDAQVSPLEWFSGPNKEPLRTFVAFCRRGGFEIRWD